jgi:outer membrane receptor protein involved in Fe transport
LLANNPSDILKSMPASNIVKIEVITTPPAKYDAEGLAGIINIITKKNTGQAYNVSVNGRYNNIHGTGLNVNGTIKAGKLGYSGNVGTGGQSRIGTDFENLSSFTNATPSSLTQTGTKYTGDRNTYNSNELSYEADSLNLLSFTFNYFSNSNTPGNTSFSSQYNANNVLTQAYLVTDIGTSAGTGTDLGFNYQLGFKHSKDELLTASYRYNNNSNNQFDDNIVDQTFNYRSANFRQYNNSGSKEYTTQLDFIDPLKAFTIEAGGKMILRDNYSNFHTDTLNTPSSQYFTNGSQTDNFTYRQNVYSLYNSYLFRLSKWTFKGGVRLEHTNVSANFSTSGSVFQQYDNLVPSLSIKHDLTALTSLVFGFTQRIQRPGITQLNPFVNLSNPLFITVGNPNLIPSVNNAFELNYSYSGKGSVNLSTHYSFANDNIQNVVSVDSHNVTTTTYANIGQYKNLGIDISVNYPITTKININVNSELLRIWLAGVYKGNAYGNSGQQGHIFTFTSYRFDKGLRIGVNVGFDSRYVLLQGVDNFYFNNAYSVSQELFNKKGSVFIQAANLFSQFNKLDFFTKTSDFQNYNVNFNLYRNFGFGFNYRFGKLTSEIKKNKRGINNDDASGGRGN